MIDSHLYRQTASAKKALFFLKYVTQRSLAVLMFIALAVVASVGNKPYDKKKSDRGTVVSNSQSSDQQQYLSLDTRRLFYNIARSIKEAANDPALIEYAKDQGIDIPDSPTTAEANKQNACSGKN